MEDNSSMQIHPDPNISKFGERRVRYRGQMTAVFRDRPVLLEDQGTGYWVTCSPVHATEYARCQCERVRVSSLEAVVLVSPATQRPGLLKQQNVPLPPRNVELAI